MAGSGSQAQIKQALKESELGLPVIVHQSFDRHHGPGSTPRTLPLALFLLAQVKHHKLCQQ